jgi:23S rRNA pseudouridine2605 synthase
VLVNGQPAAVGQPVGEGDTVTLDGGVVSLPAAFSYIAVNKPVGYVCSRRRQGTTRIIYDLLPPSMQSLRLAGRLDRDSSGLMLLSNDGKFIQAMSHPSANKRKRYELRTDKPVTEVDVTALGAGIMLEDGPSRLDVISAAGRELIVELEEGRNRQIRRTLGHLGYQITRLHRTAIGSYQLGPLPEGKWQEITP